MGKEHSYLYSKWCTGDKELYDTVSDPDENEMPFLLENPGLGLEYRKPVGNYEDPTIGPTKKITGKHGPFGGEGQRTATLEDLKVKAEK